MAVEKRIKMIWGERPFHFFVAFFSTESGFYVLLHPMISIIIVSLRSSQYFFPKEIKGEKRKILKKPNIWYCACCQYALHLNYSLNMQVGKYNKEMPIRNVIISCFLCSRKQLYLLNCTPHYYVFLLKAKTLLADLCMIFCSIEPTQRTLGVTHRFS